MNKFKRGRKSTQDQPLSRQPMNVTTPEMKGATIAYDLSKMYADRHFPAVFITPESKQSQSSEQVCVKGLQRSQRLLYQPESKIRKSELSQNIVISIKGIKLCSVYSESIEDESKVSNSEKSDAKHVDMIARSVKLRIKDANLQIPNR
ncbi:hypothetical protein LAZ67_X003189 [Cordylochernes scorpioides]|uniref:Uncharacterized protein n=1 Tax=Cordylochernes scorpioides TaxID=51811 RepID=A0ABY6LY38_9ARAC|nr:hypothetical protein LAZ67_X003189 [Cordylochernes scorpioides]